MFLMHNPFVKLVKSLSFKSFRTCINVKLIIFKIHQRLFLSVLSRVYVHKKDPKSVKCLHQQLQNKVSICSEHSKYSKIMKSGKNIHGDLSPLKSGKYLTSTGSY